MLLKNREMAFLGMMMAFAVLLQTLGGYIESSTLFFLAAAAFLSGIVERNFSLPVSVIFLAGSTLLGFFLAPRKAYVATFFMFSVYVLVAEYFEKRRFLQPERGKSVSEWLIKGMIYHVFLFLTLFFLYQFLGWQEMKENKLVAVLWKQKILFFPIAVVVLEAFWLLFDRAYLFFIRNYGRFFTIK